MPRVIVRYLTGYKHHIHVCKKEYIWIISKAGRKKIEDLQKQGPVILPIATSISDNGKLAIVRGYVVKIEDEEPKDIATYKTVARSYNHDSFTFTDERSRLADKYEKQAIEKALAK